MKPYNLQKVKGGLCCCPSSRDNRQKIMSRQKSQQKAIKESISSEEWTEEEERLFVEQKYDRYISENIIEINMTKEEKKKQLYKKILRKENPTIEDLERLIHTMAEKYVAVTEANNCCGWDRTMYDFCEEIEEVLYE